MSKKKARLIPTTKPEKKKAIISGNDILKKSSGIMPPTFKSGRYMTEKDRPRKKNWIKEEW